VVLAGATHLGLGQAALRAGAHDYVGKAWLLPETLTQAVENAIERLAMARVLQAHRQMVDAVRVRQLHLEGENRQIREATRLKSQFLANMSHELRSPLTGIIGFADLLKMGTVAPGSPQFTRYLSHIGTCGRELLRLINDLLDLAKVESGLVRFFPEPVDLAVLVPQVHEMLRSEVERKQLQVDVDIDSGLGPLLLDPARLKQVLYSYLSNAIKFTPDGGHITVRVRSEGEHDFRLEVQDSGIGIAEAELPRLFTSHRQLDASATRQSQGVGLGLALARQLVQAQQGSVGVSSTPGLGSIFHLVLARQQVGEAALHRAAEMKPAETKPAEVKPADSNPAV
jgi:signal transduction histidine kinase